VNWINNVVRPKIRSFLTTKREVPDNLWVKCPESGQMVFYKDLESNQFVVPGSGYHMRMGARARLTALFDGGVFDNVPVPAVPQDPLKFRDGRKYTDRLKDAKAKTGQEDAVLIGEGKLDGQPVTAAAQDFDFMGGSLGMAAGEAVITGLTRPSFCSQPPAARACRRESFRSCRCRAPQSRCSACAKLASPISSSSPIPPPAASPRLMRCWATSTSPNPVRSSVSPAPASSSKPSASNCRTASSAPNTCSIMA
jgi:hypothetical protein